MIKKQQTTLLAKDILLIDGLKRLEDKFKNEINAITVADFPEKEPELAKLFGLLRKTEHKVWSLQMEVAFND